MQYEHQRGHPEAAKAVFYRAIRNTPWSKHLWLDAFRLLENVMASSEMYDTLTLMNEKEIRIRKLPNPEEQTE
jgi:hypothetical protein